MSTRREAVHRHIAALLVAGPLISIGCSTANWPIAAEQKIFEGDKAVSEAKTSTASIHAPEDLKVAEEKLALARKEYANGWHHSAARIAEEAAAAAELAQARAVTEKNRMTAEKLRTNLEILKKEIELQSQ